MSRPTLKNGGKLTFQVSITPLSPVHIGVGNRFMPRNTYHLYQRQGQSYLAIFRTRALFEQLLDHFGGQLRQPQQLMDILEKDKYPDTIRSALEDGTLALRRLRVEEGALGYLQGTARDDGLKELMALSNGLPYLPGSSIKGALRTMWLDWQSQQEGAYERILTDVTHAQFSTRNGRASSSADNAMMARLQVAESFQNMEKQTQKQTQEQNRDLFRTVQVSDFIPDKTEGLSAAFAVQSMSYQRESHVRQANGGGARAQAWECLDPTAGAVYTGTVSVDLGLLDSLEASDPDARNLQNGLKNPERWQAALKGYAGRIYGDEGGHYDMLDSLPQQNKGIDIADLHDFSMQKNIRQSLFPIGMGAGLLSHSVLGILKGGQEEEEDILRLGDEEGHDTLLKDVLDLGIRRNNNAYAYPDTPAPKSRRVTGQFPGKNAAQMRAEYPLGWTRLELKPV